ncbi:hypothetical protein Tco_0508722 [Tanacetum coccineum]
MARIWRFIEEVIMKKIEYCLFDVVVEFHREMITSQLQGKLRLYDEVRARTLFVLSSSNRGRLLGIIDLMRQKNKRMKQEGLNRQIGKLQDCTKPDKMQHPVDGRTWKKFDTRYLDFAAEPRNVQLGLAVDGFNPFSNLSQSYSMWSVILTTYNLPSWLCMKECYLMLTLLILGPKSPGKDIDVYLRPLIDDLKDLWALKGVETIDVATGQKFNMRAMVLWTINDFPARSSLSGWSGQGYMACPTCNEDTPSMRVLSKTAYVGHRRFLKNPHKWRRSRDFNGETEDEDPPRKFNRAQIHTQLDRLPTREKGKHPSYGGCKDKTQCSCRAELD